MQKLNPIRTLKSAEQKAELAKLNLKRPTIFGCRPALQEEGRNIEKDILASLQTAQDADSIQRLG